VAPINRSPFHADQPAARSCLLPTNNQEQSVGSCIPTYDASGDLTKDCSFANPHTYIWNAYNLPGTLYTTNVTYDALGREAEFEVDSSYSQILYSPIGKLGVMQGQTPVRTRVPLPGGSTAEITGANSGYYILHADWLGTARLATSFTSRAMAEDVAYAPFGENYASSGNIESPLNFTGQSQDTLSGLYDFLYREYSPVQGRWISPDPAGLNAVDPTNPQSWNRYAYALNNPLSYIDPTGLFCAWDDGSYDSPDDPGTGTPSSCGSVGGNWFDGSPSDYDLSADWSDQPNANFIAQWLNQIAEGVFHSQATAQMDADSTSWLGFTMSFSAAPPQPWYKNSCIMSALSAGVLSAGIDAIGLIPEAGGIARVIGHQAGYVGVVADQAGSGVIKAFGASTGAVNSLAGLSDTSAEGLVSTGLTVAGFIPGAGQVVAGLSVGWDIFKTGRAIAACH
jgi:RHS repeat-associated protein